MEKPVLDPNDPEDKFIIDTYNFGLVVKDEKSDFYKLLKYQMDVEDIAFFYKTTVRVVNRACEWVHNKNFSQLRKDYFFFSKYKILSAFYDLVDQRDKKAVEFGMKNILGFDSTEEAVQEIKRLVVNNNFGKK